MNLIATALTLLIVGSDPGTAVFPLLKIGQGCRAAAMGESFTGLADDASAVYWNPAGLGVVAGYKFDLSHQEWFSGFRDEVGHAALPLGPGALGLGLAYTGVDAVRYWDADKQEFLESSSWGTILTAGYGWRLSDKYTIGATATGLYEDIILETGYGGAVDLGATGRPVDGLSIGFAARHLGAMTYGDGFERLPLEFGFGAAYSRGMFNFTLDAVAPAMDNNPNVRAGIEFIPVKPLALRVGYRTGPVSLSSLGYFNGLTGGLGVTVGNFGIDYAFVPYGELGLTHRIGLRIEASQQATGALCVIVLDKETRQRLPANLAVSGSVWPGMLDTTATTDELKLSGLKPGEAEVSATLDEYSSQTKTLTVVAGRTTQDTLLLKQLTSDIIGGIYSAKTHWPIGRSLVYSGPLSGTLPVAANPGTFRISDAKKGVYYLDATGPTDEYLPQVCTLDVPAGQTVKRDFYLWK